MSDRPPCRCSRNGVWALPESTCPNPAHSGDLDAYETPYQLARVEADEQIIRKLMNELPNGITPYKKRRTSE